MIARKAAVMQPHVQTETIQCEDGKKNSAEHLIFPLFFFLMQISSRSKMDGTIYLCGRREKKEKSSFIFPLFKRAICFSFTSPSHL